MQRLGEPRVWNEPIGKEPSGEMRISSRQISHVSYQIARININRDNPAFLTVLLHPPSSRIKLIGTPQSIVQVHQWP